jgi:hypothetical protein
MSTKTQTYPTELEARDAADRGYAEAVNAYSQDEETTVTLTEGTKEVILKRPDLHDGVMVVHYRW